MSIDFVPAEDYRDEVKALYKSAFPKEEQAPFRLLLKRERQGIADFYAVVDEGEFVGLTLLTGLDDAVTLFFFAIDDNLRGHGYGTEVLTALKDKYDGKRIFICVEPIEKDAPNYKQRVKRKAFYKKNGFKDMPFQVKEAGVTYDIMSVGGDVTFKEYERITKRFFGRVLYFFIKRF